MESIGNFVKYGHSTILTLQSHENGFLSSVCIIFNSFHWYFSSTYETLLPIALIKCISKYFSFVLL